MFTVTAYAALFAGTGVLYNPAIPTFNLAGEWQILIIYVTHDFIRPLFDLDEGC